MEEPVWPGREEEEEEGLSSEEEEDGEESEADGSEGEDEVEGEDQDDEGEQEADKTDEAVLQQMREQSHAIEPRERLATDRGFLCWETAQRTTGGSGSSSALVLCSTSTLRLTGDSGQFS